MSVYLLYDHFDHLLDELAHAQRIHRNVQAYVKLHEQRTEYSGRVTLETSITVTWISLSERIIHAARMVVDRLDLAADDPQRERQAVQLRERSRVARKLVIEELKERGIQPDRNLLLTAGLREELMQLETTQLLWEINDLVGAANLAISYVPSTRILPADLYWSSPTEHPASPPPQRWAPWN